MWRTIALLTGALLICGLAVWWSWAGNSPNAPAVPPEPTLVSPLRALPPTPPAGQPASSAAAEGGALPDPILVPSCSLVPVQEQDIASQVDGVFREVLVDLGDPVQRGQVLGRLDDRQLRPQVELLEVKAASRAAEMIAKAQHDEADQRVEYAIKANKSGLRTVSELEYQTYYHQRERFAEEMKKAREEQEVARKELERAQRLLDLHQLRSGLDGEVTKVFKRNGEAVKQMEPVFRVADLRRLRIEGLCRIQQADLIRVGMHALVEPEQPSEPVRELGGHTGPVTALAVSAEGRWLASASEDRTVLLWSWPRAQRQAVLPHPAEVYALAWAPTTGEDSAAGSRLLTGCGDGSVRLWQMSTAGTVTGPTVWPSAHEGAIRAVAFSADGRWCATAGEDRRIGIWDVAAGQRLYWLQGETEGQGTAHQGAVTWVQFTPDGQLLSAGRDNVLALWRLDSTSGQRISTQPGRTGEVTHPGLSSDGRRVLFDHGEELRILDREGWTCLGTLRSRRQGRFQGFSIFSPSNRLILASASNGRLQLWKTPAAPEEIEFLRRGYSRGFQRDTLAALGALASTPNPAGCLPTWAALAGMPPTPGTGHGTPQLWNLHGYEVRYFPTPGAATATCGVFAPDESVVFSGGADGAVRVWAVPPPAQWTQPWEAVITFVGSQVERGTDGVRLRAELDNPEDAARRLRPGTYADLHLYPETVPAGR